MYVLVLPSLLAVLTLESDQKIMQQKLHGIERTTYTADEAGMCLRGTRGDLLERVTRWIEGVGQDFPTSKANLFWLHGTAGSGKTSVANSVAHIARNRGCFLSSFFCKRDDAELSQPKKLFPILAWQFANQHATFRTGLSAFLQSTRANDAFTGSFAIQTQVLFEVPLNRTEDPGFPHVVIVDALDELGDLAFCESLAKQLLALASTKPWIKIFVTSRNNDEVLNVFRDSSTCLTVDINEEEQTDADIGRFVEIKLAQLRCPLPMETHRRIVERAAGLFIWCSTVFRFIEGCPSPAQ